MAMLVITRGYSFHGTYEVQNLVVQLETSRLAAETSVRWGGEIDGVAGRLCFMMVKATNQKNNGVL